MEPLTRHEMNLAVVEAILHIATALKKLRPTASDKELCLLTASLAPHIDLTARVAAAAIELNGTDTNTQVG